jgi:hypothetical protein
MLAMHENRSRRESRGGIKLTPPPKKNALLTPVRKKGSGSYIYKRLGAAYST